MAEYAVFVGSCTEHVQQQGYCLPSTPVKKLMQKPNWKTEKTVVSLENVGRQECTQLGNLQAKLGN